MTAKILRDQGSDVEIAVYSDEKYHYYPRPNLIDYLAGSLSWDRLFPFKNSWYEEKEIAVHLGQAVTRIHPLDRQVELQDGRTEDYDRLLLANGAQSSFPPIKGLEKKGVFSLRSLDDCLALSDEVNKFGRVTILGGGLLGLEIARAFNTRGADVDVIEYFDRLLWRQLDIEGSALLKSQIEAMGIRVKCGMACIEVEGKRRVSSLSFKSGVSLPAELVVIAAGIRPDIDLAQAAGLETDRGVVVDRYLRTSVSTVYAAGDLIQHQGRIYGIIPASFDQARAAAHNLMGEERAYEGTIPSNTLKVLGLTVTSLGLVNPDEGTHEEIRFLDREAGIYKKIVLEDKHLVGAIWMGTKKGASKIAKLIADRADVSVWKDSIVEKNFDFSQLKASE